MAGRNLALRHRLAFAGLAGAFKLGGFLPYAPLALLGERFGMLVLRLASRYREEARRHLQIAFPEHDRRQYQAILRGMGAHLGRMLAETAWLQRATTDQVAARCSLTGLEHLQSAREAGRGAVLVTAHCGNWELLNARLAVAGIPLTVAVREVGNPLVDGIAEDLRRRFGSQPVPRDRHAGRRLALALRRNRVVGLLIDQDIGNVHGTFVPFFGRPAWTPTGAAELSLRVPSPMIPAFIRRTGHLHQVYIGPPLPRPVGGSPAEEVRQLTTAATAAIEERIRAHPEQWVWFHKRWKTRPDERGR